MRDKLKRQILPRPLVREHVFNHELGAYKLPGGKKFDLVFGVDVFSFRPAAKLASQHGAKLVLDVNEIPDIFGRLDPVFQNIPSPTRAMINEHTRVALRSADKVFITGRTCVDFLRDFADVESQAFINTRRASIETKPDLLRQKLELGDEDCIIVYPNTAGPGFGVEETVQALKFLPETHHLCFIGRFKNENYEKAVLKLASELEVDKRVHVFTGLYDDEYIQLMSGGDVGVIPIDPAIENHVYISPARTYDLMAAELPMAFTKNNEMALLNGEYNLGRLIPEMTPRAIADALRQILTLPYAAFSRMKRNVRRAKADFDADAGDERFPEYLHPLLGDDAKGKRVAMVCNNGIVNNVRVTRYLRLLEKMGAETTLFCIAPPNERIWKQAGLKNCKVVEIDIEKGVKDHASSISAAAAVNWSTDFLKLGTRKVARDYVVPRVEHYGRRTRRLFRDPIKASGAAQFSFTKNFADKAYKELKSEKFDYVLSHDIFAFPAAERFIDKDMAAHTLDITEIPDMSQRAGASYREMPERLKKKFGKIEQRAQESSGNLYTFCHGMEGFLNKRYDRKVKTLLNAREPYTGQPDPFLRQKLGIPDDAIVLVANCTFSPESRPATCINALRHLPEHVYLLFLGNPTNGGFGRRIAAHAARKKLSHRVRFHPPVYGARYLSVLAACDIGLNIFNCEFDQLRLILPNRVLDLVAAKLPFVSSPMEDVVRMTKKWRNGYIVEDKADAKKIAHAVNSIIEEYGIFRGGYRKKQAEDRLQALANSLSWKQNADTFVDDLRQTGDGKKVLFLARQRLHSNNRIFRQCRALNEAGLDVHLVGAREGPNEDLAAVAPETRVTILDIS